VLSRLRLALATAVRAAMRLLLVVVLATAVLLVVFPLAEGLALAALVAVSQLALVKASLQMVVVCL
jgi:hypothetical protein